jgi:diacylglycerol kinase (ATP)
LRISLLYNADAGRGIPVEELRRELQRNGYELVSELEKGSGFQRVLKESVSFLVVAGGDGTVGEAALALAGRGIPLAVLPLGTANNIAKSLGIDGPVQEVIRGWRTGRRVPVDLGVARGIWGESRFLEGVGSGLVPEAISAVEASRSDEDGTSPLAHAVRGYRTTLARLAPRRWTLTVDGDPIEGEFLLVEILNIRFVGPNVLLSPGADPSDGLLDVVTAGESQREDLDGYLRRRIEGQDTPPLSLPVRRGRQVEIQGWERMHVDDEVRSSLSTGKISVGIAPRAIDFMI